MDIPSASIQTGIEGPPAVPTTNPPHNHQPKPSPSNHNNGDLYFAAHGAEVVDGFTDAADLDQRQPWQNLDGSSSGRSSPAQHFENDCSDELFASFLDSLVSDDLLQHSPLNNMNGPRDHLATKSSSLETEISWETSSVVHSAVLLDDTNNNNATHDTVKKPISPCSDLRE